MWKPQHWIIEAQADFMWQYIKEAVAATENIMQQKKCNLIRNKKEGAAVLQSDARAMSLVDSAGTTIEGIFKFQAQANADSEGLPLL